MSFVRRALPASCSPELSTSGVEISIVHSTGKSLVTAVASSAVTLARTNARSISPNATSFSCRSAANASDRARRRVRLYWDALSERDNAMTSCIRCWRGVRERLADCEGKCGGDEKVRRCGSVSSRPGRDGELVGRVDMRSPPVESMLPAGCKIDSSSAPVARSERLRCGDGERALLMLQVLDADDDADERDELRLGRLDCFC